MSGDPSSPEQVVRAFCDRIREGDHDGVAALLDDSVTYHNVGMEPAVGKAAAVAALDQLHAMFASLDFRIVHLAVDGDAVLTERVDDLTVAGGGPTAPVPVMGTFVVRDGRITAWRDYFDMALVGRMMAGEDVGDLAPGL